MITVREQRRVMARIDRAMERRHPVSLTFFEVRKDGDGKPMHFADGRPMLVLTRRTVEPYEWYGTQGGNIVLRTADRTAGAREGEAFVFRTPRLDRIAAASRGPLVRVHTGQTFRVTHDFLPPRPSREGIAHS